MHIYIYNIHIHTYNIYIYIYVIHIYIYHNIYIIYTIIHIYIYYNTYIYILYIHIIYIYIYIYNIHIYIYTLIHYMYTLCIFKTYVSSSNSPPTSRRAPPCPSRRFAPSWSRPRSTAGSAWPKNGDQTDQNSEFLHETPLKSTKRLRKQTRKMRL